jgi:hypothetical protein
MPTEAVLLTDYRMDGVSDTAVQWITDASRYHRPSEAALMNHDAVATACERFLSTILVSCPPSRDRTIAINKVREARMWANSAIATGGKL